MCLPNFIKFKNILESEPLVGYRTWLNLIKDDDLILRSEHQNYNWKSPDGPHEVEAVNSGLYSYNNYNNYYHYNYYNNYYNNYDYYNNSYNYNYNNHSHNNYYYNSYYHNYNCLLGIIHQYGKVAIHEIGYRSEYANINSLFKIRESDAQGPKEFLEWIKKFNQKIDRIAEKYNCKTINWQDFLDSHSVSKS